MSELNESRDVQCPYHLAQRYLAESLKGRAEARTASVTTLSMKLSGLTLQKNVIVTFGAGTDPMHFDQPWQVHWTPEGGGLYPDFDGELTVRSGEDYTSAILELRGHYEPPGGLAGAAFDMVAGSQIAKATAAHLLAEIAGEMEQRYRRDEDAKHTRV
jgi:hypothetical protein